MTVPSRVRREQRTALAVERRRVGEACGPRDVVRGWHLGCRGRHSARHLSVPRSQARPLDVCSASTHIGDAADGSILDWKTANAGEPVRIKVSGAAKSVEVHGCETFTKVA